MSCLFNSLHLLLKPEIIDLKIKDLRQTLVEYMEKNQNYKIADTPIKEWLKMIQLVESSTDYLSNMRISSTWGGAPEIIIAANCFQVKISVIYKGRSVATFEPENKDAKAHLYINWNGVHYTALKRVNLSHLAKKPSKS